MAKTRHVIFQAFLSETHEQQTSSITEITWRQRKIQVTNEKARSFFLNLQEFQAEIKVRIEQNPILHLLSHYFQKPDVSFDTKMSLYESFLKEAVETSQMVKDELKNDPVTFIHPLSLHSNLLST